jgi:hypothetical protein
MYSDIFELSLIHVPFGSVIILGCRAGVIAGFEIVFYAERRDEPFVCLAQVMPERSEEKA